MLALVAAALAAAPARATILPSGTYRYAVHSDGKITATSTVVISHDASSLTVGEVVDLQGESEKTTRTLDPVTFATLSWSGQNDHDSDTVTLTGKNATYRHAAQTTTLEAPAAGAPSAVFDFFVAEFATLPAMIHASSANRYNEFCICIGGFQVKPISIVPATASRPAGALAGDAAIALTAEGETASLWYDPQTFILRELDFPRERISYIRI